MKAEVWSWAKQASRDSFSCVNLWHDYNIFLQLSLWIIYEHEIVKLSVSHIIDMECFVGCVVMVTETCCTMLLIVKFIFSFKTRDTGNLTLVWLYQYTKHPSPYIPYMQDTPVVSSTCL